MAKSRKSKTSFAAVLFGLPFLAVGVTVLWFLVAEPLRTGKASAGWPKVDCEVVHSALASSSDGDTYRVDIRTSYNYNGQKYHSGSFDLNRDNSYSSGYSSKRKVINKYPIGWQGRLLRKS